MILNKLKKKQCDDKGVLPFSKDSKIPPLWYLFREYIYIFGISLHTCHTLERRI